MKRIILSGVSRRAVVLFFPFLFLCLLHLNAQTAISDYRPGVTAEGAVYYLPKTAVRIMVEVERSTFTPGDFCSYSERYLRLRDVPSVPSVSYRITAIRQEACAVADTSKCYAVKFDARTSACNVRLSDDGILLAINTDVPQEEARPENPGVTMATPRTDKGELSPRRYLSEEILAAGSTAKMAELTALEIYDIRESRNLLTRGQADYMPKDGEQLRLMLSQLEQQDRALTSLFTGTTVNDTTVQTFIVVPDSTIQRHVLFRFSQKLGIVDSDDLAGVPYYISIEDISNLPAVTPTPKAKSQKPKSQPGIYVNIPGKLRTTIANGDGILISNDYPAGQFGYTELLSGALFNKRYTTRLLLHPVSGAIERLDAEQPK